MTAGQGGSFLFNIKFISVCPVINVCGVFSNTVLSSSSGGGEGDQEQWKYTAMFVEGMEEVSGTPLASKRRRDIHLVLSFLLETYDSWEEHNPMCRVTSVLSVCMCVIKLETYASLKKFVLVIPPLPPPLLYASCSSH